jgi:hypothetical protein
MPIHVCNDVFCPRCGAGELHPKDSSKVLIRVNKVSLHGVWYSQCLVCSGYYDKALVPTPDKHDPKTGWFADFMCQ